MTSTQNGLVLQPPETTHLQQISGLLHYLKDVYTTASRFKKFVSRSREVAFDLHLGQELSSDQIDPALWQAFVEKMCAHDRHRHLLNYDKCWPLRVAHDIRVAKYLRHLAHRSQLPAHSPDAKRASDAASYRPHHRVASIPARCSQRVLAQTTSPKARPAVEDQGPAPHKPYLPFVQRTPRKVGQAQSPVGRLGPLSQTYLIQVPSVPTLPGTNSNSPFVVHVGCLDCGYGSKSIGPRTLLFTAVGEENPEHAFVLINAGMVDDSHLEIFRRWSAKHRALFIEELPTTPFVRHTLLQKLGGSAPSVAVAANAGRPEGPSSPTPSDLTAVLGDSQPPHTFSGVPQPSKELERALTDPNKPVDLLCAAMELDTTPKLFNQVLQFFKRDGFPYLCSFQPSDEEIEKAVKAIARERLLFERYENYWPIRFLIKRIVRRRNPGSPPSIGPPRRWIRPPLSSLPQPPSGPPSLVHDCPSHAGPDLSRVSFNIQLLLHHRGLSEFAPIFAYLGVRTDTDFIRFCAFSSGEKEALVEKARGQLGRRVLLNAFQVMALKLEFTADRR